MIKRMVRDLCRWWRCSSAHGGMWQPAGLYPVSGQGASQGRAGGGGGRLLPSRGSVSPSVADDSVWDRRG